MPLRKWFANSRPEIWRRLSHEVGGKYVDGGFWKGDKVVVEHGEWTITLDAYYCAASKVMHTRLRAPYLNPEGFRFFVRRKSFFDALAKRFGLQDVEVGHPDFDEDFIIKGNDEGRLIELFDNARIRELLAGQQQVRLQVLDSEGWFGPKFPPDVDELNFVVVGVLSDLPRLAALFELFAVTLDHLCRIGSAYEDDPGVAL